MIDDLEQEIAQRLRPMAVASNIHSSKMKDWLKTQPDTRACEKHPLTLRKRDDEQSIEDSWRKPNPVATYLPCADCESDAKLVRQWVPPISCGCSFDTFIPDNEEEREHLERCKKWASNPRGVALLRGDIGTGKTHLAVAMLRYFGSGKFVPQRKLLDLFNETARFKGGEKAQENLQKIYATRFLVLDDVGASSCSPRDIDLLQKLITHRYEETNLTVITTNLDSEGLQDLLGKRIVDRLSEVVKLRCVLQGSSKRSRYDYLGSL